MSNAIKFSSTRDRALVEVGAEQRDGTVAYFVRDNGVGFDMECADQLFKVFHRLHRSDEFPGTGIGLSLVRDIVHRHGGEIWFEATPDEGATFFFSLEEAQEPPPEKAG